MGTEKKFYRVRIKNTCAVNNKMVNGIMLTKQWQVKVGEIGDFAKFPDVEAQVMVKQGNDFVPAEEASKEAEDKADGLRPVPAIWRNLGAARRLVRAI